MYTSKTFSSMCLEEKSVFGPAITHSYSNCEKQTTLLMIPDEEKGGLHYLAVKILSALLHGKTSKHKDDFYYLNCLHSFRTENKLVS